MLGRLARALAAGAHFSLDRFSDVYLITDAIAAHSVWAASGGRIGCELVARDRRMEITIGPFRPGTGTAVRGEKTDRARSPLVLLSDEVSIREADDGEFLHVVLVDHRR